MALVKLCLLLGKKCQYQKLKNIPRKGQFQIKICKAKFPCNQQLLTHTQELAEPGPCDELSICPIPSGPCRKAVNKGVKLPRLRWVNCWAYANLIRSGNRKV